MFRILFTGGGTGGHITPLISVAAELQKLASQKNLKLDLRYFGSPETYENLLETNGIAVSKIASSKWRRYFDLRNFIDIPKFIIGFFQALWKVFWFMPDVAFSKGGPGALPVVLVCAFYRVPIMIHESDTIPGLTNKISGRYAKRIALSFASAQEYFKGSVAVVGTPIRHELLGEALEQGTAKKTFGFDAEKPVILVISGSQGATRINDFMLDCWPELVKEFQILHQTGINNFPQVKSELTSIAKNFTEEEKNRYKIVPYFEKDLKDAYAAADIVVSRAGSASIFEIAAFGKPAILIPLPEAAGDHQTKNAYEYAATGAAIVIETDNLTLNVFINQLKKLLSSLEKLKEMSEAAKKFAKPEAAKIIAEEIIKLAMSN